MSLTKRLRVIFPEAIPTPCAIVYNSTVAKVLRKPEKKIANDIVEKIKSGTVLDLGSGTGYLAIEIAKMAPSLQVYGVDLSKGMIKIARRHAKGVENARFKLGNVAELPFEDDTIDFIFSTGSLHHWRDPAKAFDECYRVLKSGKEAWIYDGCPDAIKDGADRVKKEYGRWFYRLSTRISGIHGFTMEEYEGRIKNILDQSKFKDSYQMELKDLWMRIALRKHG